MYHNSDIMGRESISPWWFSGLGEMIVSRKCRFPPQEIGWPECGENMIVTKQVPVHINIVIGCHRSEFSYSFCVLPFGKLT